MQEPDAREARLRLVRVLLENGALDAALETLESLTVTDATTTCVPSGG